MTLAVALNVSSKALFLLAEDAHTIKQTGFLQSSLCNWSSSDNAERRADV